MRSESGYPPIHHHIPLSDNYHHPQPISDPPSFDTSRMRSYDSNDTHRTDLYAVPNQRNAEGNVHSRYSTKGLAHEISTQHSQLFSQVPLMRCENCHIVISGHHLMGNSRICSNCLVVRRPALPVEPSLAFSSRDSAKLKQVIDDDAVPVNGVIRMKVSNIEH